MNYIKFRFWDKVEKKMITWDNVICSGNSDMGYWFTDYRYLPMQYIGLNCKHGLEIYIGDICAFKNGDTFIVKIENWLEYRSVWITTPPKDNSQLRDFYTVGKSDIIGNIHENPELL